MGGQTAGQNPLAPRDQRMLRDILRALVRPVELWAFLDDGENSADLAAVLLQLDRLARDRLTVHIADGETASGLLLALGVGMKPTLRIVGPGGEFAPVEIVGAPRGYQFGALIHLLAAISGGRTGLPYAARRMAKNVKHDILLEVGVTPTCPHSPQVVRIAQDFALTNPARIFARSVDLVQMTAGAGVLTDAVPVLTVYVDGKVMASHVGTLSAERMSRLIQSSFKGGSRHAGSLQHH